MQDGDVVGLNLGRELIDLLDRRADLLIELNGGLRQAGGGGLKTFRQSLRRASVRTAESRSTSGSALQAGETLEKVVEIAYDAGLSGYVEESLDRGQGGGLRGVVPLLGELVLTA